MCILVDGPFRFTAPRPHDPERRSGHRHEARHHPGVRQAGRAVGPRGQRLRILRPCRQMRDSEGSYKCNCTTDHYFLIMYDICKYFNSLIKAHSLLMYCVLL